MSIRELYQETILDHNRQPRNRGKLENATTTAEGYNPLCGDKLTVYMTVEDETVKEISFEGGGCAISTASASLMTEALKGKPIKEVEALFEKFHKLVTSDADQATIEKELGKLFVFAGIRDFPIRVKCATLAWHTMHSALKGEPEVVTTE